MAAFKSQGFGGVRHAVAVALEFGEQYFTLEDVDALSERPADGRARCDRLLRQSRGDGCGLDALAGKQQQALDNVAQLAHIARPRIAGQRGLGLGSAWLYLPPILVR